MAEDDASLGEALHEVPLRKSATCIRDEDLTKVVGEVALPMAMTPVELAACEDSCAWCFQTHRVELVQSFLSLDGQRAVMIFRAPDAESVRLACRGTALPVQRVWTCQQASCAPPCRCTPSTRIDE